MDDYFLGDGEAPGVWQGRWAAALGLNGVVDAEPLRRLVEGFHPLTGEELLSGLRPRRVHAFDATFSAPKSVSLLWAFGTEETASVVSIAHVEATTRALAFLERQAAVARRQVNGVRQRVPTQGFAVATFVHRTSRAGDPQLHTHCLVPNVIERYDGAHVAFDADGLHEWAKAAGTMYQSELQRLLTLQLGVEWGPERHGTRELVGFTRAHLRTFSKRSVAIEARLEAACEEYMSAKDRMRADDRRLESDASEEGQDPHSRTTPRPVDHRSRRGRHRHAGRTRRPSHAPSTARTPTDAALRRSPR